MKTFNASHVKTHFAEVLNIAQEKPVRVKRRGHSTTVLLAESEYEQLKKKAFISEISQKSEALRSLRDWAWASSDHKDTSDDDRVEAIETKHGSHWTT